ncbi:MAG: ArnT family glycosyltransferase [Phycisphaerales bacterium JB059]
MNANAPTDARRLPFPLVLALLALACLVAAFLGRILGPSDLLQNTDQSKTIALTADVVANARWALPRDALGHLTRKPPLVNWVAALPVSLGFWSEWAFKLPSLLAALAAIAATAAAARFLLRRPGVRLNQKSTASGPVALALLGAMLYLASPSTIKHLYFCRPDMLFTACLAWGWYAGVRTIHDPQTNHRRWALLMWVAAGLALLAKGPLALLVPAYALLAPLLIERRPALLARAGFLWGLPLMLAIFLLWLVPAWLSDRTFVEQTLIGEELLGRFGAGATPANAPPGPGTPPYIVDVITSTYEIPSWFVERFLFWAPFALLGLAASPPWRWRSSPLAPAALWVLMVFITTMLIRNRGGSYLMPSYPAASVLALGILLHRRSFLSPRLLGALALLVTLLITGREVFLSRAARTGAGDHAWAFARAARAIVLDDPVVFVQTGHTPVPMMMGRARAGEPSPEQVKRAPWIVRPLPERPDPDRPGPDLISEPLLRVTARGTARAEPQRLGLFRATDPR